MMFCRHLSLGVLPARARSLARPCVEWPLRVVATPLERSRDARGSVSARRAEGLASRRRSLERAAARVCRLTGRLPQPCARRPRCSLGRSYARPSPRRIGTRSNGRSRGPWPRCRASPCCSPTACAGEDRPRGRHSWRSSASSRCCAKRGCAICSHGSTQPLATQGSAALRSRARRCGRSGSMPRVNGRAATSICSCASPMRRPSERSFVASTTRCWRTFSATRVTCRASSRRRTS